MYCTASTTMRFELYMMMMMITTAGKREQQLSMVGTITPAISHACTGRGIVVPGAHDGVLLSAIWSGISGGV